MIKKPNIKKLQAECDAWNASSPIGTKVTVKRDGVDQLFPTVTRSAAEILIGHIAVIWLEGISGCYLLDRVKPLIEVTLEAKTVPMLLMTGGKNLDPIRVVLEDLEPGKGRILIVCYTRAWTGYWGAMGNKTISEFFTGCDAEYLLDNLATSQRQTKVEAAYLIRIIEAVQAGLRQHAKGTS